MSDEKNIKARTIKLYDDEWEEFKKLKSEQDGENVTDRQVFLKLMNFYNNPKTIKVDNPELIKKNQELADEIDELQDVNTHLKEKIEELNIRIEEITNSGNESAMAAQRIQMELDKANETIASRANRPENVFEVEVHPVAFYFLKKKVEEVSRMKKKDVTPGYILVDLFVKDLQNPRANNLPGEIVSSSEIEKKMKEYKNTGKVTYDEKV